MGRVFCLIILLLLVGCNDKDYFTAKYQNVMVVGDSLCAMPFDIDGIPYPYFISAKYDCRIGRKLTDYPDLPSGYDLIFLGLGTNDGGRVPIEEYRDDLEQTLANTESDVICLLPDSENPRLDEVYATMLELCTNTIDMREYGYTFSANDGIHGRPIDHKVFGLNLKEVVEDYYHE